MPIIDTSDVDGTPDYERYGSSSPTMSPSPYRRQSPAAKALAGPCTPPTHPAVRTQLRDANRTYRRAAAARERKWKPCRYGDGCRNRKRRACWFMHPDEQEDALAEEEAIEAEKARKAAQAAEEAKVAEKAWRDSRDEREKARQLEEKDRRRRRRRVQEADEARCEELRKLAEKREDDLRFWVRRGEEAEARSRGRHERSRSPLQRKYPDSTAGSSTDGADRMLDMMVVHQKMMQTMQKKMQQ